MEPDKDKRKNRKAAREVFEELGRSLRRTLPQRRLADLSERSISAASHAEEPSPDCDAPTPREDRAG
jgi:hypothetical protein